MTDSRERLTRKILLENPFDCAILETLFYGKAI
jgi:hypothetical protein